MSKESINAEIESFTTSDGNETAQPEWSTNGVPECSESCRWHDGKRCELLGQRPGPICEPSVVSMYELLEDRGLLLNRIDGLNSQPQTQTENMRALREFVEMVANSSHFEELPGDLICQAQDLIGTLK